MITALSAAMLARVDVASILRSYQDQQHRNEQAQVRVD
jgi:hypothetical protein